MGHALTLSNKPLSGKSDVPDGPVLRDGKGRLLPGHNLRSSGVSANAGSTLMRHVSLMSHFTPVELEKVAADCELPALRIAAARWLLRTQSEERLKSGASESGAEIDRLLDRTLGRPKQHVDIDATTRHDHILQLTEANLAALGDAFDDQSD